LVAFVDFFGAEALFAFAVFLLAFAFFPVVVSVVVSLIVSPLCSASDDTFQFLEVRPSAPSLEGAMVLMVLASLLRCPPVEGQVRVSGSQRVAMS
jgi:hypothetical protein